ncbi:MAG: DUF2157 domain-containing protein [Cyclobacteriaceae bacterium]
MSKHILKGLPELLDAGLISEETSEKIKTYYLHKEQQSPDRLVLIFGILGALLTGLGIILIIAHNWDDFSRAGKLFFALLPLLSGQLICAYTLFKKPESRLWREAGSVFLLLAIAASISIVSQVYNIPGDISGFLFIWMLLSIPLIYVMKSAMTSLLVICGITWYACSLSYFNYPNEIAWYYWPMLAAVIPFFISLMKNKRGNVFYFHSWLLALSIIISLGMFESSSNFIFIAYMSLFSLFVLIGESRWFSDSKIISNAFLVAGSLGSTILLLMGSFDWMWKEIAGSNLLMDTAFVVGAIVSSLAALLLVYEIRRKGLSSINPKSFIFLIFIPLYALAMVQPEVAQWLTNMLVLAIAVVTTWRGAERDNIFILNYGLLILAALILCRFFDTNLSLVARGILFVIVGLSFFGANYWVLRKRKLQNA